MPWHYVFAIHRGERMKDAGKNNEPARIRRIGRILPVEPIHRSEFEQLRVFGQA